MDDSVSGLTTAMVVFPVANPALDDCFSWARGCSMDDSGSKLAMDVCSSGVKVQWTTFEMSIFYKLNGSQHGLTWKFPTVTVSGVVPHVADLQNARKHRKFISPLLIKRP